MIQLVGGRYFNGHASRPESVSLWASNGSLRVIGTLTDRQDAVRTLRFTPAYQHSPSRITFFDGASCEIAQADAYVTLRNALRRRQNTVERLESARLAAALSFVIILAVGICSYLWFIPIIADVVADRLPAVWRHRFADTAISQLRSTDAIGPIHEPTPREKLLLETFRTVVPGNAPPYQIVFCSMQQPNAFALPDGRILVSDEIVELSQGEAAGPLFVMAHELGHVANRHGVRSLVRSTMVGVAASWMFGDLSSALATVGGGLASLRFSRTFESEADAYGIKVLRDHGIPTEPAARLFESLAPELRSGGKPCYAGNSGWEKSACKRATRHTVPSFLSTHPDPADRIAALRSNGS